MLGEPPALTAPCAVGGCTEPADVVVRIVEITLEDGTTAEGEVFVGWCRTHDEARIADVVRAFADIMGDPPAPN